MATVVFYEKPGCANNARQKGLLTQAGHTLIVRDLLQTPWSAAELRTFFGARPVAEWFNRAAPRVKSGEVVPENLEAAEALALMLSDPLLIRRPLLQVDEHRETGFDPVRIAEWIGLAPEETATPPDDLESCRRVRVCPPPGTPAR